MRTKIILGALVLSAVAAPVPSFAEDQLTRANCWAKTFDDNSVRTMCFFPGGPIEMTNDSHVTGSKTDTSVYRFIGRYEQKGETVTVKFQANSGKCTNGANAPEFHATCKFPGTKLTCEGSSTFGGQTYDFSGTLE